MDTWIEAPELRRPRVHPRLAASENGKLIVVGGSLVPGMAQIAGEHVAVCEVLLPKPAAIADRQVGTAATTGGGEEGHDHAMGAATETDAAADPEWAWADIGAIPSPEAYAGLKLQIQVVRGCVVCVQPIQPTTPALANRRDSCHIYDVAEHKWYEKEACQRIRYR